MVMIVVACAPSSARSPRSSGRPITADDVEPTTWLYLEGSGGYDGGAYVEAVAEMHRWTRRMVSWWLDDGFDLLLTPTIAEPPPVLGDVGNQDDGGLNAAARRCRSPSYARRTTSPASPRCRCRCIGATRLPIGVQLVAAPFREDLLFRVAGQLEAARPWANRRPPVHAYGATMADRSSTRPAQAELVRSGEASPLELVDAAINRIEKVNGELNAVIHPLFDSARAEARRELPDGPFRGVPLLFKDLVRQRRGRSVPRGHAVPEERGLARRPHRRRSRSGISTPASCASAARTRPSSGSCRRPSPSRTGRRATRGTRRARPAVRAAVRRPRSRAAWSPVAHANDGGGSIRIPASCCGLVGLKPSRGRASLGPDYSAIARRCSSAELCVTRTVRDTAAVLDALHGRCVGDTVVGAAAGASVPRGGRRRSRPAAHRRCSPTTRSGPTEIHPDCVAAATRHGAAARVARPHRRGDAIPRALDEPELVGHFTTLWARTLVVQPPLLAAEGRTGREVTRRDGGAHVDAGRDGSAQPRRSTTSPRSTQSTSSRRDVDAWCASGYDLLLTPTLGEPPVPARRRSTRPTSRCAASCAPPRSCPTRRSPT